MALKVPQALAAEWRARLKASGFKDLETADGRLKEPGCVLRAHIRNPLVAGLSEYYRRAGMWTHDAIWPSRLHRRLWELHVEGEGGGDTGRLRIRGRQGGNMRALMGPSAGRHHRRIYDRLRQLRAEMLEHAEVPIDQAQESLLDIELSGFPTFDRATGVKGASRPYKDQTRSKW